MDNVQNLNNGTFVFFDHFKFLYLFSTWKVKELLWLQFCLLNKIFSLQNCDCNWFILTIEKLQVRYQFTVPLLLIKFYFVKCGTKVFESCQRIHFSVNCLLLLHKTLNERWSRSSLKVYLREQVEEILNTRFKLHFYKYNPNLWVILFLSFDCPRVINTLSRPQFTIPANLILVKVYSSMSPARRGKCKVENRITNVFLCLRRYAKPLVCLNRPNGARLT